jgi:hypothetical protein
MESIIQQTIRVLLLYGYGAAIGPHAYGLETISTDEGADAGIANYQFPEVATLRSNRGFEVQGDWISSNSANAKAFRHRWAGIWLGGGHPEIGRNTLIFWNCGGYFSYGRVAQTIQHKLLMPHPSECGRNRQLDRATTARGH